jgi:hypothetical protein
MALEQARKYVAQEGREFVVDLDLEKFLDPASYCPLVTEKFRLVLHNFDSQAFASALPH